MCSISVDASRATFFCGYHICLIFVSSVLVIRIELKLSNSAAPRNSNIDLATSIETLGLKGFW